MVQIFATTRVRYGHKDMQAGEAFEASDKDAKVLTKIGKATYGATGSRTDLPPRAPGAEAHAKTRDITALRAAYQATVGKRPFGAWKAEELQGRIDAHRAGQTYQRRDMRAEG